MKFTLAEKVAMIYTAAGSQRRVANFIGISHQKVGRLLRSINNEPGGYAPASKILQDPALAAMIESAFTVYKDVCRDQCRRDRLPFLNDAPLFAQRLSYIDKNGELREGERVVIQHAHWLPDYLRNWWIARAYQSEKFFSLSIMSIVDLAAYFKRAEDRIADSGLRRTKEQIKYRSQLQKALNEGQAHRPIYTRYFDMTPGDDPLQVIGEVDEALIDRHAPATQSPGTLLATEFLLQTPRGKNDTDTAKG